MKNLLLICSLSVIVLLGCKKEETHSVFELSTDLVAFDYAGSPLTGDYPLRIHTTSRWTITGSSDWIGFSQTAGEGDATVTVTVQMNSGESRQATFEVAGAGQTAILRITQKAGDNLQEEIPDKVFREYCLRELDRDGDGRLSLQEVEAVTRLSTYSGIYSFQGIELFTNLEVFYCYGPEVSALDLSSNKKLRFLYIQGGNITELDLTQNDRLTQLIYQGGSQGRLTSLDLTNCPALVELNCNDHALQELDLSNNKMLQEVSCVGNELTALKVVSPVLRYLECYTNRLTDLDVSLCGDMRSLNCSDNQLKSLDLSAQKNLTRLSCTRNQLSELRLPPSPILQSISCGYNDLTRLDVSSYPDLNVLNCEMNRLSALDLSASPWINYVNCEGNGLTTLTFGRHRLLELICAGNRLRELDLSGFEGMQIYMLVCTGNPDLSTIYVWEDFNFEMDDLSIWSLHKDSFTEFRLKP